MTDASFHDLMLALPPTLAGLAALVGSIGTLIATRKNRAEIKTSAESVSAKIDTNASALMQKADDTTKQIEATHLLVNGTTNELIGVVRRSSFAEGKLEGAADHKQEMALQSAQSFRREGDPAPARRVGDPATTPPPTEPVKS